MCTCMLVSVHLGAKLHTSVNSCISIRVCCTCDALTCVYINVHGYIHVGDENIWAQCESG